MYLRMLGNFSSAMTHETLLHLKFLSLFCASRMTFAQVFAMQQTFGSIVNRITLLTPAYLIFYRRDTRML